MANAQAAGAVSTSRMLELFRKVDTERTGRITQQQLTSLLEEMVPDGRPLPACDSLFQQLDQDGDGVVAVSDMLRDVAAWQNFVADSLAGTDAAAAVTTSTAPNATTGGAASKAAGGGDAAAEGVLMSPLSGSQREQLSRLYLRFGADAEALRNALVDHGLGEQAANAVVLRLDLVSEGALLASASMLGASQRAAVLALADDARTMSAAVSAAKLEAMAGQVAEWKARAEAVQQENEMLLREVSRYEDAERRHASELADLQEQVTQEAGRARRAQDRLRDVTTEADQAGELRIQLEEAQRTGGASDALARKHAETISILEGEVSLAQQRASEAEAEARHVKADFLAFQSQHAAERKDARRVQDLEQRLSGMQARLQQQEAACTKHAQQAADAELQLQEAHAHVAQYRERVAMLRSQLDLATQQASSGAVAHPASGDMPSSLLRELEDALRASSPSDGDGDSQGESDAPFTSAAARNGDPSQRRSLMWSRSATIFRAKQRQAYRHGAVLGPRLYYQGFYIGDSCTDMRRYMRFYRDGTVLCISLALQDVLQARRWLVKRSAYPATGLYRSSGPSVRFTLYLPRRQHTQHGGEDAGTDVPHDVDPADDVAAIEYAGHVRQDGVLQLSWMSHLNGQKGSVRMRFNPCVVYD